MGKEHSEPERKSGSAGWTAKRVIALAAVGALAGLYVLTFVSALLDTSWSGQLFRFCLGMTIAVPIVAWVAIWAVGVMSHRHTIASMDLLNSNEEARREMEAGIERELGGQEPEEHG